MTSTAPGAAAEFSGSSTYRTKLIEVALPLEAINVASAREKSIRHGHPSTLHLWWARRPLAACRAVLFAQLVDDPSAVPEEFPTEEAQETERQRLFRIIENLVLWENSTKEEYLMPARREIARSVARSAGIPAPNTDDDVWRILREHAPPVLDPFCGGGSIPLEAQRLGLEAHASDLNPVAILITKALIEIPPMFAGMPPVNPRDRNRGMGAAWKGAAGLAADVRYYGEWMRDEAFKRIGHLYPKAKLVGGGEATVIAWLWARTVSCPNPACGAQMPLVRSFAMCNKRNRPRFASPIVDQEAKAIRFEIERGSTAAPGTVSRQGAICLSCGQHVPLQYVRSEGRAKRIGQQMMAVVTEGMTGRDYAAPTPQDTCIASEAVPEWEPATSLPEQALGFRVQAYGMTHHRDLFTQRQLVALTTFADLVKAVGDRVLQDGADPAYASAVTMYLGLSVSRLANRCSGLCFWDPVGEKVQQVFARQTMSMIWDFVEVNPFSESSGNFLGQVDYLANALAAVPAAPQGSATVEDAAAFSAGPRRFVIATDPPYYDNVPYADLSDFFYIWLRVGLRDILPDLFRTLLTPKAHELIVDENRHRNKQDARDFFERGLGTAFKQMLATQQLDLPLTVFYAFRQAESSAGTDPGDDERSDRASTGWETMLHGMLTAGFSVIGTWPVRTEYTSNLKTKRNALASSIVLVCRPRPTSAVIATRREFIGALREELPPALKLLTRGSIAAVDLAQAAIGPGMRVFSRYAKVIESNGDPMTVRAALGLINQILYEVQAESESEYDSDTRWAITWFEQFGMVEGPFGDAETLFKAKDTSKMGLEEAGIIGARGGKVWLLRREALSDYWDPLKVRRLTVWSVTQHLIRALDTGGETVAADILRKVGGLGEAARDLAYALYLMAERKKWADEAMAYNTLAVAWPEITRLAASMGPAQAGLGLE